MKSRSFFKGLSWLLVLNLVVKPVWIFGIDRQVQNLAGHEAYGAYFATFALSVVLLFLADAGITGMMNRQVASGQTLNLRGLLQLKVMLGLLYLVVLLLVASISGLHHWKILLLVGGIQLLTSFLVFFRNVLTAHQRFTTDAFFSVFDKLLMIGICGFFLFNPSGWGLLTLERFLEVQLLVSLLAVTVLALMVWKNEWLSATGGISWKEALKKGLPFLLVILLMSVHYRLDGFLLERLHNQGALQAGIYATAYRLLDAANMAGYLAASFLVPFVARNQASSSLVEETVLNVRHGLLFYSVAIACFCLCFAPWIQELLYHTSDPYNSQVLGACLAALPGYMLVHVYGSVLTAKGALPLFIRILVATVALNIVLNLFLIPAYGAWGACLAALSSQYACGLLCYYLAASPRSVRTFLGSFLPYLALAAALLFFFELGKASMLNVWLILALAALATGFFLATQITFIKRHFIRLR